MRESELLNHIYRRSAGLSEQFAHVVVGPGDDCAVIRTPAGDLLVATVDQIISGRHFRPGTPVDRIARKLIARSVSDIAAMGGAPTWTLATGALPSTYEHSNDLFEAMTRWASHFRCPLIGGDIATLDGASSASIGIRPNGGSQMTVGGQKVVPSFVGRMVLTCTVVGTPHPHRGPVQRSTARPGDEIWVTGRLGGSLHSGRHLAFSPRVGEGAWLCDYLGPDIHAMIDISDGLGRDAGRMAAASNVRIEFDEAVLPLHEDVHGWEAAVSDGEDYELCFAVEPGSLGSSGRSTCRSTATVLTRIGRVVELADGESPGSWLIGTRGEVTELTESGWEHGDVAPGIDVRTAS